MKVMEAGVAALKEQKKKLKQQIAEQQVERPLSLFVSWALSIFLFLARLRSLPLSLSLAHPPSLPLSLMLSPSLSPCLSLLHTRALSESAEEEAQAADR